VIVPPPQSVAGEAGVALKRPPGYVSVKDTPVTGTGFGLARAIVSVEVPPERIGLGRKLFIAVGAVLETERVALAGDVFDPPLVVVTSPALIVLV
jgi:hypothetical protein